MLQKLVSQYAKQLRFVIAGGTAFVVDAGSLSFMLYVVDFKLVILGIISIPNVISVLLGLITSYILNRVWTFSARQERVASQGSRFVIVFAFTYIANQLLFGLLTEYALLLPLVAKVIVTSVQMFSSYLLYSRYVFTNHQNEQISKT